MKHLSLLLISFFVLSFAGNLQAQTFTFQPGEIVTEHIQLESYNFVRIDMTHPDFDDITFGWVTIENTMLEGWEYTSCDNGGCYSHLPDSATIGPLPDTVPGFIRMTVNPRDVVGTSTVQIYVYNIKFPEQGHIVSFEIIAMGPTAINDHTNEESTLLAFPNPASNFITLDNSSSEVSDFELMDMSGKLALEGKVNPTQNKTINVAAYPRGVYFLRFQQGVNTKSQKIIIQ